MPRPWRRSAGLFGQPFRPTNLVRLQNVDRAAGDQLAEPIPRVFVLAGGPFDLGMCRLQLLEAVPIIRLERLLDPVDPELGNSIGKRDRVGNIKRQIAVGRINRWSGPALRLASAMNSPIGAQPCGSVPGSMRQGNLRARENQASGRRQGLGPSHRPRSFSRVLPPIIL